MTTELHLSSAVIKAPLSKSLLLSPGGTTRKTSLLQLCSFHFIVHHYFSPFLNLSFPLSPPFPEVGGCAGESDSHHCIVVGTTDNLHGINNWLTPAPKALRWTLPHLGLFSSFIPSFLLCLYIYSLFPGVIKMHFSSICPIFSLWIHWTILMFFSNPQTNTSCILLCQSVKPVCLYFSFSSTCKVFSDEIFPIIQLSESEPGFKYTYSTTRASLCWLCGLHTITHTCTHIHTDTCTFLLDNIILPRCCLWFMRPS